MGNACTLTLAALLVLAGCSPGDEERVDEAQSEIQGGSPDYGDDAVVGVILVDDAGRPHRSCTGSLIAPNLVLTAQHCIADTRSAVDCSTSVFGPPVSAYRVRVTTSPLLWSDDATWTPVDAVVVPGGGRAVCGRDVALVRLAEPLPGGVAPLVPRLDDEVRPEEPYTAIGYGASKGQGDDGGLRRRRDRLHILCVGDDCDTHTVANDEWRGDHGICNGDSGGPAIDASGAVIGVTSRGPVSCDRPIYGALAPHAAWIRGEALLAAEAAGYDPPAWVVEAHPLARRTSAPGPFAAGGGCTIAPPSPSLGWWPALAAFGVAALIRRR